jgi:hypothetical protein
MTVTLGVLSQIYWTSLSSSGSGALATLMCAHGLPSQRRAWGAWRMQPHPPRMSALRAGGAVTSQWAAWNLPEILLMELRALLGLNATRPQGCGYAAATQTDERHRVK